MSVPAHISLVTLGVSDLARSVAFYEALGWQRSNASDDGISFFRLGGVMLGLFGAEDLAADACQSPRVGGFRGVTLAINVLSTEAVDRMFHEFVTAGADAVKPPEATEWGGYSGYVADPDGHLWELAFNPYSPEWAAPGSE
jgi:predicted lactoylglutathione lyase